MPNKQNNATTIARREVADIAGQIASLRKMKVAELREKYRDVFGEPTRSNNKAWLCKKISWRIQEMTEGGLSSRAKARIEELAIHAPLRWRSTGSNHNNSPPHPVDLLPKRDPRLPEAGTVLVRTHNGAEHRVTVLGDGFEYLGEHFLTLSRIARKISGKQWNGFLFFGLQRRARKNNGETG